MTGSTLVVCRDSAGVASEAPWDLVVARAAHAVEVIDLDSKTMEPWLNGPQSPDATHVVLGIGPGAELAHRLALRLPTTLRLVVADAGAPVPGLGSDGCADSAAAGTASAIPIAAISSAPPDAPSTVAMTAWRHRTTAVFEIRTLPDWRSRPDAFLLACLRHLHEAGVLAGPDDAGFLLGLRP